MSAGEGVGLKVGRGSRCQLGKGWGSSGWREQVSVGEGVGLKWNKWLLRLGWAWNGCRYLDGVRTCTVPLLAGDQVAMSGMLKLAPVNHPWLLSRLPLAFSS